jgi:hypothetical protein
VLHPILKEYADVLSRPELAIRKGIRQQLLQLVKNHSHIVTPYRRLEICTDPDDNVFLECADAARRLPDYWQSAAFPEILEENQGNNDAGIY